MQPVNIQQKLIFKTKKRQNQIDSVFFIPQRVSIVVWVMKLTKTFYSSMSMISQKLAYQAGNFETTGSKFSNETAKAGCLRPNTTILRKSIINYKQTSSRPFSLIHPHHLTMLNHYLYDPLNLNPLDESLLFPHLSK